MKKTQNGNTLNKEYEKNISFHKTVDPNIFFTYKNCCRNG
jgi:hypothetical protein